jgi:type IV secretion system protein VirD4
MSRGVSEGPWGPSHQHMEPPSRRGSSLAAGLASGVCLLFLLEFLRAATGFGAESLGAWTVKAVIALVLVRVLSMFGVAALTRVPPASTRRPSLSPPALPQVSPAAGVRARVACADGGAYLGVGDAAGGWAVADPESAVMVLGPPRSGKTSAVMIPALMACSGAAVSTSTKPDVMRATLAARSEVGQAWLFDPAGEEDGEAWSSGGVRRLCWSPVAAASTWDRALVMARAMTAGTRVGRGTTNESHWSERAAALLGPLLYAAHLSGRPIADVLRWTLRQDLAPALEILADSETEIATDVLIGIERTDTRERSSIFSATAGVLSAYNADAVRESAARPNFDPVRFATSTDTIYVTAPEHKQALCAPLIVGLLEQIRHAVYRRARDEAQAVPSMLWLLDEVANIAPIPDLPALVSQAGGQRLQIMVGLQDLSQARARWGQDAADGFLSLFQTRLVLSGIADTRTLEAISLTLGEYDRDVVSQSLARSDPQEWFATPTHSDTVSYQTQRQRVLTPGEIARLPDGRGLLLRGADWGLLRLTKWHENEPWRSVGAGEQAGSVHGSLVREITVRGRPRACGARVSWTPHQRSLSASVSIWACATAMKSRSASTRSISTSCSAG